MHNIPVTLLFWVEHPPGQQRESERSARKSSCSEQTRTQTPGRAGGDWQQSADTTGFEEEGKCSLLFRHSPFSLFCLLSSLNHDLTVENRRWRLHPTRRLWLRKRLWFNSPRRSLLKLSMTFRWAVSASFKGSVHQNIKSVVLKLLCHDYKSRKGQLALYMFLNGLESASNSPGIGWG